MRQLVIKEVALLFRRELEYKTVNATCRTYK